MEDHGRRIQLIVEHRMMFDDTQKVNTGKAIRELIIMASWRERETRENNTKKRKKKKPYKKEKVTGS